MAVPTNGLHLQLQRRAGMQACSVNRRGALLSLLATAACKSGAAPSEGSASSSASAPPEVEPFAFRTDVDASVAHARKEKLRLIVFFSAEWNVACKEQQKVFASVQLAKAAAGFVGVLVDVTNSDDARGEKLMRDYRVTGVPTTIVFDSSGKEVQRATIFEPVEKWLERLAQVG